MLASLFLAAVALQPQTAPAPAATPAPAPQTPFVAPPVRARLLTTDLGNNEYPREARARREQGTTIFEVDIGANGRVTACRTVTSSGSAVLDAATCRIMQARLRFEPARDAQGQPTTDSTRSRFTWTLPANRTNTTR